MDGNSAVSGSRSFQCADGLLLHDPYVKNSPVNAVCIAEQNVCHTQKLSVEFHERYTAGRVIARQTSDLESISELLSGGLGELVVGIFFMVFTAGALLILDPISFLVLMAAVIPLAIVTRWFQINTNRGFRAQRVASSTLIQNFVETMTGIRAVKAFRKEGRNEKHFGGLVEKYRLLNARLIQLFGIYDPALILIGNATVAAILLVGGFRVLDGTLGIGVLTAAILYARSFSTRWNRLQFSITLTSRLLLLLRKFPVCCKKSRRYQILRTRLS